MNNQFVKSYCDYHGLDIKPSKVKGENYILLFERKIGFTDNLNRRERELNSTKMTVGYTIALAWDLETEEEVEDFVNYTLTHH